MRNADCWRWHWQLCHYSWDVFFNVCLHSRSFSLRADWRKSDSSVIGEPQGNWRRNSNSRDVVASSPSFPRPSTRAPRTACSQANWEKKKRNFFCCVHNSMKRAGEIRKSRVAVTQRWLKSVMHVQSCRFANINLRIFCRCRCLGRCPCLISLLLWFKHFATMVTWRHTSPFYIVSDISDHYFQFALFHSPRENTHIKKRKIRDYSHFVLSLNMLYFK